MSNDETNASARSVAESLELPDDWPKDVNEMSSEDWTDANKFIEAVLSLP